MYIYKQVRASAVSAPRLGGVNPKSFSIVPQYQIAFFLTSSCEAWEYVWVGDNLGRPPKPRHLIVLAGCLRAM